MSQPKPDISRTKQLNDWPEPNADTRNRYYTEQEIRDLLGDPRDVLSLSEGGEPSLEGHWLRHNGG